MHRCPPALLFLPPRCRTPEDAYRPRMPRRDAFSRAPRAIRHKSASTNDEIRSLPRRRVIYRDNFYLRRDAPSLRARAPKGKNCTPCWKSRDSLSGTVVGIFYRPRPLQQLAELAMRLEKFSFNRPGVACRKERSGLDRIAYIFNRRSLMVVLIVETVCLQI